jgi:acyl-lipid omega-6 desaturase (Delta-12 desaturase)
MHAWKFLMVCVDKCPALLRHKGRQRSEIDNQQRASPDFSVRPRAYEDARTGEVMMSAVVENDAKDAGNPEAGTLDAAKLSAGSWGRKLNGYRKPDTRAAIRETLFTAVPFALVWYAMVLAVNAGQYWLYGLLIVPAAGLLVRLFMIQHDCSHGSFLPSRKGNDWLGRIIGVFTLTPYGYWRRSHAMHHSTSGNLGRRGIGDIDTLTIDEYQGRSRGARLLYRLYRHPIVMFGLGPAYLFLLQNRLPLGFMRNGRAPWISTMGTNLSILAVSGLLIWAVGLSTFLMIQLPVIVLAGTAGVWLFYVQHQFEDTHWAEDRDWNPQEAALDGSSHYDLPPVLRWFSANIGVHHVHHLSSRIPFYRLQEVLRDHPELRDHGRLTLRESLKCVRLVLWDDQSRRLVSFQKAREIVAARSDAESGYMRSSAQPAA